MATGFSSVDVEGISCGLSGGGTDGLVVEDVLEEVVVHGVVDGIVPVPLNE